MTRVRNCGTPEDADQISEIKWYTCGDTVLVVYSDERQELAADPGSIDESFVASSHFLPSSERQHHLMVSRINGSRLS